VYLRTLSVRVRVAPCRRASGRARLVPARARRAAPLEPHLDGLVDESERLWPLLMFQLWHLLYVDASTEQPSLDLQSVLS
jgi:hypothetical protein